MRSLILSTAVIFIAASSCGKDGRNAPEGVNTPIADYLYGVEYEDYDLDANVEYINNSLLPDFPACSEVRKGRFVGRNLDWYINNDAAAIIKMGHTKDHYASIGMVGCCPEFSNALARSGAESEIYRYLPFYTTDGINEKGLYIGVNVMPTGETSFDPSTWEPYAYGHGAAHTNPSSDMHYCTFYLVRIVLDRAGSVAEAKKVIDGIDWSEPVNFPVEGCSQAFHWMICDAKESVILEFIDNKAYYTEAASVTEPSLGTIMTNFTNCLFAKDIIQTCGCGYERWEYLRTLYPSAPETFEGMQDLMSKVWYTNAYAQDPSSPDFWFTEWYDNGFNSQETFRNYALCEDPDYLARMHEVLADYKNPDYWHSDDSPLWYTTHTSIYDLKSKTLRVLVHEGLDGQKEYFEASLSKSHLFAKFAD